MSLRTNQKGNALIEFALVAPLLFLFLFSVVDFGFYAYSFISVENAARAAASRNASGYDTADDQETACAMVIEELRGLPNIGSAFQTDCSSAPVQVSSVRCDASTACLGTVTSADGKPASAVTVTYTLPAVFRMPIPGPAAINRTFQMKVRSFQ